jgi:hypothetical protein
MFWQAKNGRGQRIPRAGQPSVRRPAVLPGFGARPDGLTGLWRNASTLVLLPATFS